jgi:hypothetical protein
MKTFYYFTIKEVSCCKFNFIQIYQNFERSFLKIQKSANAISLYSRTRILPCKYIAHAFCCTIGPDYDTLETK